MRRGQAGFGVIPIIAIILVIGVLGFVGWRVFVAQTNNSTGNNQAGNTQADPNAGFIVIREWGVRFKPVSGLSRVEYSFSNAATFTTQELKSLDVNCSGQVSGVTVLGQIDRSTEASVPHYPASFAKVGDYYYYYHSPEATCSDMKKVQDIEVQQIPLLKQSVTSLEVAK